MTGKVEAYLQFLREEFDRRRLRNASYTFRAYARDLKVPLSSLSPVLSRKRKMSERLMTHLTLAFAESEEFAKKCLQVSFADVPEEMLSLARTPLLLKEDDFAAIGEWHFYAILNLTETASKLTPELVANRLGLPQQTVDEAVQTLVRLGLLKSERGTLVRIPRRLTTASGLSSTSIRKYHRGLLKKVDEALENVDPKFRDITSTTMAVNVENLAKVKKIIQTFRKLIAMQLGSGPKKEVYSLQVSLIPLSRLPTSEP